MTQRNDNSKMNPTPYQLRTLQPGMCWRLIITATNAFLNLKHAVTGRKDSNRIYIKQHIGCWWNLEIKFFSLHWPWRLYEKFSLVWNLGLWEAVGWVFFSFSPIESEIWKLKLALTVSLYELVCILFYQKYPCTRSKPYELHCRDLFSAAGEHVGK